MTQAAARKSAVEEVPGPELILTLAPYEEKLLRQLDAERGRTVAYETLCASCGTDGVERQVSSAQALKVHITRLREKLRKAGADVIITNVRRQGYRLDVLKGEFAWRRVQAPSAADQRLAFAESKHERIRTFVEVWKAQVDAGVPYREIAAAAGVNASTVLRKVRRFNAGELDPEKLTVPSPRPKTAAKLGEERRQRTPFKVHVNRNRIDELVEPWIESRAQDPATAALDRRVAALLRTGFAVTEAAWILDKTRETIWRSCDRMGVTEEVRLLNNRLQGWKPASALTVDHDLLKRLMDALPHRTSLEAAVGDMKPLEAVEHLLYILGEMIWAPEKMSRTPHPDLTLTDSEAVILHALWRSKGSMVRREALHTALYATDLDAAPDPVIVQCFMVKIRKKISDAWLPIEIRTVRGEGWELHCDDDTLLNWTR